MNNLDFWSIGKESSNACWSKKNTDAMKQIVWSFLVSLLASSYAFYCYKNSPSMLNLMLYAVLSVGLCLIIFNVFLINIIDLHINEKQTLGTFKAIIFSSKMIRALVSEIITAVILALLIYITIRFNNWLSLQQITLTSQGIPQLSINFFYIILFIIIDFKIAIVTIINALLFVPAMILGKNIFIILNFKDSGAIFASLMLVIVNKLRWILLFSAFAYMMSLSKYDYFFTTNLIFLGSVMIFPITITTIIITYKQLLATDKVIKLF